MRKEEFERVDMRIPDYENPWAEISRSSSLCFRITHTDPMEESSRSLVRELIPGMPESSHIMPPVQIDMGANVKIGNHVFINHGLTVMARGGIEIEDDVMIGPGASLLTANHDLYDHQVLLCGKVTIRKNAWIGAKAMILPGVTVGENAVVAGGSVVTKDVEPNTVVGGNPARVLKYLDAKTNGKAEQ